MSSHLDLEKICIFTIAQIKNILGSNYVIIQQYQEKDRKWAILCSQVEGQTEEIQLDEETDRQINRKLSQNEIVEISAQADIANIKINVFYMFVPLFCQQRLWGRIVLVSSSPSSNWFPKDLDWLQLAVQQLALFIDSQITVSNQNSVEQNQPQLAGLFKSYSNKLKQKIASLEDRDSLKDEFIGRIVHDLRAPLMNMKMAIKMTKISLAGDPAIAAVLEGHKAQNYLDILESDCDREMNLINNILDLQKLEITNNNLYIEKVILPEWLPNLVEPFLIRTQQKQQTLEIDIPFDLPPLITDRQHLGKILTELLNNACKYTDTGKKINLTFNCSPKTGQIAVLISNQSTISAENLPHIFDKFYRIPQSHHLQQSGTGLGLSLVQKLVETLQGKIMVTSEHGWTIFQILLPIDINQS